MSGSLKELDHHCGALINLLTAGTGYFISHTEWQLPLMHLKVASGLKGLDYDASRFDDSIGWCGPADTMVDYQEELERALILELSRFHFIWASLEAAIDIAVPLKTMQQPNGKINKACTFIKSISCLGIKFDAYLLLLDEVERLLRRDSYYGKIYEDISIPEYVDVDGKGIFLAYKLRNRLAHGALSLPLTMEGEEEHLDTQIVRGLSRLVLFTIQRLAIIDLEKDFEWIAWRGVEVPTRVALTHIQWNIHPEEICLESSSYPCSSDQLSLDLEGAKQRD